MLRIYDDDAVQEAVADWLLVDFSSNDAAFGYYYGATNFSRSDSLENSPVAAATEVMLRYLIAEHPSLPILVIESTCHSHASRHAHERAASRYGVPFLAYADALSNGTACSKAWHLAGHSHVHPTWETHAVLAEMLAQWWRAFSESLLPTRESLAPPAKVDDAKLGPYLTSAATRAPFGVCGSPVTVDAPSKASSTDLYRGEQVGATTTPVARMTIAKLSLLTRMCSPSSASATLLESVVSSTSRRNALEAFKM